MNQKGFLMNDEALLRYSRHILLDEWGVEVQERIKQSKVLIVGAGGLASPAALYLTSAGVGQITIADHDTVDFSNLQRQLLHRADWVGKPKVDSAKTQLFAVNPEVVVMPLKEKLFGENLQEQVKKADVVLDCCDNFATRHAVNRACVAEKKPLVSGASIRFSGQISVFDCRDANAPCYHCLFPEVDAAEETRCAVTGVFAPLVGIIGCTQAAEALKILGGIGEILSGNLLLLDTLTMQWRSIRYKKDGHCAVCSPAAIKAISENEVAK